MDHTVCCFDVCCDNGGVIHHHAIVQIDHDGVAVADEDHALEREFSRIVVHPTIDGFRVVDVVDALIDTEKELREYQIASGRGDQFEQWSNANFIGTPDQVAERIADFVKRGCSGFIPWCVDYPDKQTLTEFAKIMKTYR